MRSMIAAQTARASEASVSWTRPRFPRAPASTCALIAAPPGGASTGWSGAWSRPRGTGSPRRCSSILPSASIRRMAGVSPTSSVRPRQAEHALGQITQDELARHRRKPRGHCFAEIALHVVFAGIAHAAVGAHRAITGAERRIGAEIFRRIGLRAAGLAAVVELRRPQHQQLGGQELGPAFGKRMLDRLVLADRPAEHDALLGVGGGLGEGAPPDADGLGGVEDAFRIDAVEDVAEALAL